MLLLLFIEHSVRKKVDGLVVSPLTKSGDDSTKIEQGTAAL